MSHFIHKCCISLLCLALFPAAAMAKSPHFFHVRHVTDSKTIVLADGSIIRLATLHTPDAMMDASRRALTALTAHHTVRVEKVKNAQDRHGRTVAHVYRDDGLWLQGEMVKHGMAMVMAIPHQTAQIRKLYRMEDTSRKAGKGLWSNPVILPAGPAAAKFRGTYALVEGTVKKVTAVRDATYINFGEDWKTDFSLRIAKTDRKYFADVNAQSWEGKRIRVRGWLYVKNGPMIDLTHPEQVELL